MSSPFRSRLRRSATALAAVIGIVGVVGAATAPAAAAPRHVNLTVLGTSDVHGHVLNWDYYTDKPYSDADGNSVGLAKVSTVVNRVRHYVGRRNTLLVDNGDVIQGTPLDSYYATVKPITDTGATHPMAAAMNAMGYDAGVVGNHEFNYGVDYLRAYQRQLHFPLMGANVSSHRTGAPAFAPYVIRTMHPRGAKPVRVGILGLTTPGSAIWDKPRVSGHLDFTGVVGSAKQWVPRMRAAGADVVIVAAHSGIDTSSSYGDALPWPENASKQIAENVPGIDLILAGHTHLNNAQVLATNKQTGHQVVISQPGKWGQRLSRFDLSLTKVHGRYQVASAQSSLLNPADATPDPKVVDATRTQHDTTVSYVNSVIGTSTDDMPASASRYEDTAALDFINTVQTETVHDALADGSDADLPVLSIAAPFNRDAGISKGDVTVRDIAGLYEFDNTLLAVKLTGKQVKQYLEKSAEYFQQVSGTGPYPADDVTNAPTEDSPDGTPDYLYDVISGVQYDIDIAKPAGQRIENLSYDGKPIEPDAEFAVAINNYRQSGGGNFPFVTDAPVVYNEQVAIRESLIDWVQDKGTIDPSTIFTADWQLTANGDPVQISG